MEVIKMKIVNEKEFNETIASGYTVVDFYADWCGPCKMLGPIIEQVSEQFPNVDFIKVNVDQESNLARQYGIMSIPSVFFFKDGQKAGGFVGYNGPEKIAELVNQLIAK